jgi:hypothetical protein
MPVEVEPPELARLLNYTECSRVDDWTLRAALVRYAQPEPARVGRVLDVVRRIEFGLEPHTKLLASDGPALWAATLDGNATSAHPMVVGLLRAMAELDRLGDRLAAWAADTSRDRPDAELDATVAAVAERLDALGVPHEERQPPPRGRRGG